ncbi:MAG TPA: hypothetical protein VJ926_03060 [Patescibacteria group bacterium]|nr:hypothetical protein [Patescibacteria group bacterium]
MKVNRNFDNSDKNKPKTKLIIFGIFSIAILVFWVMQMQANIKGPFQLGDEYSTLSKDSSNNIGTCTGSDCLSDTELRDKDTDGDGLSDWEEINIYGTSAYLADSDSDGISDYNEIQQGTDPNCAEGSDCSYNDFNNNGLEGDLGSTGDGNLDFSGDNISVPEDEEKLKEALSGSINLEDLKTLLLESGVDEKTVNSFSDEELNKIYKDTLSGMSQDFNNN